MTGKNNTSETSQLLPPAHADEETGETSADQNSSIDDNDKTWLRAVLAICIPLIGIGMIPNSEAAKAWGVYT